MSISPTASVNNAYPSTTTSVQQSRRQNFDLLSQALQSGDLSGAQQAFAAITQSAPPRNSSSDGASRQSDTRTNDIKQLAQALQSGDLAGAQKAFAALKQDAQNMRSGNAAQAGQQAGPVHHHGGHHHATSAQPSVQAAATGSDKGSVRTNSAANPFGSNINTSA